MSKKITATLKFPNGKVVDMDDQKEVMKETTEMLLGGKNVSIDKELEKSLTLTLDNGGTISLHEARTLIELFKKEGKPEKAESLEKLIKAQYISDEERNIASHNDVYFLRLSPDGNRYHIYHRNINTGNDTDYESYLFKERALKGWKSLLVQAAKDVIEANMEAAEQAAVAVYGAVHDKQIKLPFFDK